MINRLVESFMLIALVISISVPSNASGIPYADIKAMCIKCNVGIGVCMSPDENMETEESEQCQLLRANLDKMLHFEKGEAYPHCKSESEKVFANGYPCWDESKKAFVKQKK